MVIFYDIYMNYF